MIKKKVIIVEVSTAIINAFSDFKDFVSRGLEMMNKASFVKVLRDYLNNRIERASDADVADNLEHLIGRSAWIWETPSHWAEAMPFVRDYYREYLVLMEGKLRLEHAMGLPADVQDLLQEARGVDRSSHSDLSDIVTRLKECLESSQKDKHAAARDLKTPLKKTGNAQGASSKRGGETQAEINTNSELESVNERLPVS